MAKFSTGLRTGMLGSSGFKDLMTGAVLRIYAGYGPDSIPETADASNGGSLLITLTSDGVADAGLNFEDPVGGIISKESGVAWMTNAIENSGNCTYFRLEMPDDNGMESDTAIRVQGTCGLVNADMVLVAIGVVPGGPWTLNHFNLELPTD